MTTSLMWTGVVFAVIHCDLFLKDISSYVYCWYSIFSISCFLLVSCAQLYFLFFLWSNSDVWGVITGYLIFIIIIITISLSLSYWTTVVDFLFIVLIIVLFSIVKFYIFNKIFNLFVVKFHNKMPEQMLKKSCY